MHCARQIALLSCLFLVSGNVSGQQPTQQPAPPSGSSLSSSLGVVVFPAKKQTAQQQSTDETYCYGWAKSNTGIDPMNLKATPPQSASTQPTTATGGERVKGAAGGAAGGAAIGAVAGDAGKGAAIGAVTGALAGGAAKRRKAKEEAEQQQQVQAIQAQQAQAALADQKVTYNRSFSACMEGKGYTTK